MSSVPKLFGVSAEASQAAEDALSFNLTVPKAPYPVTTSTDPKSGDQYHRWAEVMVIQKCYLETSPKGLTTFVVEGKIRPAQPNQNRRVWGRHYMNFDEFAKGDGAEDKARNMNDRSIAAIKSLLKATSFLPEDGSMPVELLSHLFPVKNATAASPLASKSVTVYLCNQPNKGEGAKTDRRTQTESYSTPPGA
jgi:hypothetical protein